MRCGGDVEKLELLEQLMRWRRNFPEPTRHSSTALAQFWLSAAELQGVQKSQGTLAKAAGNTSR
jgi:hypothetical protein